MAGQRSTAIGGNPLQASRSAWQHGRVAGQALPDPDSAPGRLSRFFASLDARQRGRLAHRYPLAVGNMNGAPVRLRYTANRIAIGQQRGIELGRMHDNRLSSSGTRR